MNKLDKLKAARNVAYYVAVDTREAAYEAADAHEAALDASDVAYNIAAYSYAAYVAADTACRTEISKTRGQPNRL